MTDRTELRRLLDEATPRPWEAIIFDSGHSKFEFEASVCTQDVGDSICRMDGLLRTADNERYRTDGSLDALLIAAAVNALPSLLDQLDAAEAALQRVRELHAPYYPLRGGRAYCDACEGDEFAPYPCATTAAIGGDRS